MSKLKDGAKDLGHKITDKAKDLKDKAKDALDKDKPTDKSTDTDKKD
jgi:hypothetical protein